MKIIGDNIMYLILFALITLSEYRHSNQMKQLDNRVNEIEDISWNLAAERGRFNKRLNSIELRNDSLCFLYLHSNK